MCEANFVVQLQCTICGVHCGRYYIKYHILNTWIRLEIGCTWDPPQNAALAIPWSSWHKQTHNTIYSYDVEQVQILLVFLWVNLLLHCMPKKRHNFCHQNRQKVLSKWRCLIIRAANLGTEWINTTLVGCTSITLTSCVPANSFSIPESDLYGSDKKVGLSLVTSCKQNAYESFIRH